MALRMGMVWKIFIEVLGLEEERGNRNWFSLSKWTLKLIQVNLLYSYICFWPTKWIFFRTIVCNLNSHKTKPCFMNQWDISLNKVLFNESKSCIWLFRYFKHVIILTKSLEEIASYKTFLKLGKKLVFVSL